MTEQEEIEKLELDWDRLLFGVRRSIRYHTKRFDFLNKWGSEFCFLTGMLSILVIWFYCLFYLNTKTATRYDWFNVVFLSLIGFSSAIITLFSDLKRDIHSNLALDFQMLEEKMVGLPLEGALSDKKRIYSQRLSDRLKIEMKEPPKLSVLDLICHDELTRALGRNEKYTHIIPIWKRRFANFFDFDTYDCISVADQEAKIQKKREEAIEIVKTIKPWKMIGE